VVKELRKGKGSFSFDYLVTAVRAGFESHQPVAENEHFRPTERESVAEFEKRYRRDDMNTKALRDMMIANGILTEDGKLNRETVARLGWTVKEADLAEAR